MASQPEPTPGRRAIVVDTSAAVAVLFREPAGPAVRDQLRSAPARSMSAPTVVELGMVLTGRLDSEGDRVLRRFLDDADVEVVPFDEQMSRLALDGFRRFGKGRHPARLNLGDCFTYALAAATGEPVLCTGDDFARTDVEIVELAP